MASVQERLQKNRMQHLENWSISEQLHLASAVAYSGDQNWMSVSRSLKMMCGNNRPSDWFSQKSCAAQYQMLLENVETPKRKKRNEKDTSQTIAETPIELIVRKLTLERIAELKNLIQGERDEYSKIKEEISGIQNGKFDENQLREMCANIDAEEKQREKEKTKYQQWMKEREEKKREYERNAARSGPHLMQQNSPTIAQHLNSKVKLEEMEIDDPNARQGTSPLLTSLLKSPSAAPNPSSSMLHSMNTQTRVAAPTITNLLTGSITNVSSSLAPAATRAGGDTTLQANTQTIISSGSSISTPFSTQLPLTGPAQGDQSMNNMTQRPSQAAPTLSMLLENKHKENAPKMPPLARIDSQHAVGHMIPSKSNDNVGDLKAGPTTNADVNSGESPIKDEDQQLMEVFSELIPGDIDELADIILDDLIDVEPVATVSAADNLVAQDSLDLKTFQSSPTPVNAREQQTSVKEETNDSNENAGDASAMINTKTEETFVEDATEAEDEGNSTKNMPQDDDSSDLSNDTPLAELIKQEATVKQNQLEQSQQQQSEQKENEELDSQSIVQDEQQNSEPIELDESDYEIEQTEKTELTEEAKQQQDTENLSEQQDIAKHEDETGDLIDSNDEDQAQQQSQTTQESQDQATSVVSEQSGLSTKKEIDMQIDTFESDSNEEKSLENIKREIQALPELKDNGSSDDSCEFQGLKTKDEESEQQETTNDDAKEKEEKAEKAIEKSESVKEEEEEMEDDEATTRAEIEANLSAESKESEDVEFVETESVSASTDVKVTKTEEIEKPNNVENVEPDLAEPAEAEPSKDDVTKQEIDAKIEILDEDIEENEPESTEMSNELDDSKEEKEMDDKKDWNDDEVIEIKDDKSESDKPEAVIVVDEIDDVASEDNAGASTTKTEEATSSEETPVSDGKEKSSTAATSERKVSSDDELFEDAKENLDDIKEIENEPEPEPMPQPPPVAATVPATTVTVTTTTTTTTITIDTDDDSPMEVIKEDKVGRTKRDYSRRSKLEVHQSTEKRSDDTATANEEVVSSISSRLRRSDRDRSESPFIEEDSGEPVAKSRRRYSTTPVIDSLPNSPASSDDREYRSWKKSILLIYQTLAAHKCASLFAKPITEDQAPNYKTIVLNPMDLLTLKRNIDSGTIRTTIEFQRYVMLMCYNAIMYNTEDEVTSHRAKEMLTDAIALIEDFANTWKTENEKPVASSSSSSATKVVRGRKSNRLLN